MEDTSPKTFVFVLMPFSDELSDVYDVGIEPACKDASAYCERVDKQIFLENILERVYNQIAKADVIVAEMTGRNSNVFYEVGYAHALNKRVILLTQNADDIPFDLKHFPHIVYGRKIAVLKSELEKRIRWCVENPKDSLSNVDPSISLFVRGIPLEEHPVISNSRSHAYFTVDIHNQTNKVLAPSVLSFALVTPERVTYLSHSRSIIRLSDGRYVFNLITPHNMFPDSWDSIEISFNPPEGTDEMNVQIRMFTELGPRNYEVKLQFGNR